METDPKLMNEWMDTQIMVYACNGILFIGEKEWNTDKYFNVDKPPKLAKYKRQL